MDRVWAPWRMDFILSSKEGGCPFCVLPQSPTKNDRQNLILYRGTQAFVLLNLYPYTNGHLMVIPYVHQSDLSALDLKTHQELGLLQAACVELLKNTLQAEGINVGMNLGKVAGAGIEQHLHYHLVPRWIGDHNFMPVIADSRVLPEYLVATYDRLKEGVEQCSLFIKQSN